MNVGMDTLSETSVSPLLGAVPTYINSYVRTVWLSHTNKTHKQTHTQTQTYTHTHTQIQTHTETQTHTHTHTHAHTQTVVYLIPNTWNLLHENTRYIKLD